MSEITFAPAESGPNAPVETPPADPNRPEGLPDNFQTVPDLAKSYSEAQAELTRTKQELAALKKGEQPAPAPNDPPANPPADPQAEAAQEVAEAAGFDLNPFQAEFNTSGDVAEESRAKIADGLKHVLGEHARAIVDDYIDGRKLIVKNDQDLFMQEAGGEENYASMITWAGQNMTPAEIKAYDNAVETGDRAAVLLAIGGLRAKYEAANGRDPNLLVGGAGRLESLAAFESTAQMTAAMRDPRYRTDPAYRETVKRRIAISPNI